MRTKMPDRLTLSKIYKWQPVKLEIPSVDNEFRNVRCSLCSAPKTSNIFLIYNTRNSRKREIKLVYWKRPPRRRIFIIINIHLRTSGLCQINLILSTRYDMEIFKVRSTKTDDCHIASEKSPNWIVMANSTNTFKCRLDTCWQDQIIFMHSYREPS